MKASLCAIALLALAAGHAFAGKVLFPDQTAPQVIFTVPDDWKPEADKDGSIHAQAPDEHAVVVVWQSAGDSAEAAAKDLATLLKDHAKDVKAEGDGEKVTLPGGIAAVKVHGAASDKEDGSAIKFSAVVFAAKGGQVGVVLVVTDAKCPATEAEKAQAILATVKKPVKRS